MAMHANAASLIHRVRLPPAARVGVAPAHVPLSFLQRLLPNWQERLKQLQVIRARFGRKFEPSPVDFTRFTFA